MQKSKPFDSLVQQINQTERSFISWVVQSSTEMGSLKLQYEDLYSEGSGLEVSHDDEVSQTEDFKG